MTSSSWIVVVSSFARSAAGELRVEATGQFCEVRLEEGNGSLSAVAVNHLLENGSEGLLVAAREQSLRRGREPIGEGRSADSAILPFVGDQTGGLELLEMMPDGVQGSTHPFRQVLGRKPALQLQLNEYRVPQALVAEQRSGRRV